MEASQLRGLIDRSFPHVGAVVAGLVITVSVASLAVGQFIPPIQTDPPGPGVITYLGCEDPAIRIEIGGLRNACKLVQRAFVHASVTAGRAPAT